MFGSSCNRRVSETACVPHKQINNGKLCVFMLWKYLHTGRDMQSVSALKRNKRRNMFHTNGWFYCVVEATRFHSPTQVSGLLGVYMRLFVKIHCYYSVEIGSSSNKQESEREKTKTTDR